MAAHEVEFNPTEEKFIKGDYRVHIYIEESKGLMPIESDEILNPIISIKCFGKTKCTKKIKGVGPTTTSIWNEHIYFSRLKCSVSEILSEKIIIRVKDSKTFKDPLIGSYEFDLTHVYHEKNHCILHTWVALSNPYSEEVSIMRGLLKLGISILHSKDQPVDLTGFSKEDKLLVPPQVKLKAQQLVIQFFIAQNLPIMDSIGTLDAYCVAKFGHVQGRTRVIKADEVNLAVEWNEEILLPAIQPCISDYVEIFVWDEDLTSEDDLVGSLRFKWKDVKTESESKARWSNIYGAPHNVESKSAKKMNLDNELASHWRGRILMRLFIREDERPVAKRQKISDQVLISNVRTKCRVEKDYRVLCQVLQGSNLPLGFSKYSISINFDQATLNSRTVDCEKGMCTWFETLQPKKTGVPHRSFLPDIFVYLMNNDKPICFSRLKAKAYADLDKEMNWIKFRPNKVVRNELNDWEGGFLLLRVCVFKFRLNDDPKSWIEKISIPAKLISKKLVCNLYQCRNLPAADSNGLADPYVKVICGSNFVETDKKGKRGILNPIWYKQLIFDIEYFSIDLIPPIMVQVWDHDILQSDDLIGGFLFDRTKLTNNPEYYSRPTWNNLNLGSSDSNEGEILIGLSIFDPGHAIPKIHLPEFIDIDVEIYALGFRDLKPALGWLPVNKAFLKIDLATITFPGESELIQELKTHPISSGCNPNLGDVLTFRCKIPKDPLYCPTLSCNVYDYLMSGICQPLIGSFGINFNKLMSIRQGYRRITSDISQDKDGLFGIDLKQLAYLVSEPFSGKKLVEIDKIPRRKRKVSLSEAILTGKIVYLPDFEKKENGKKVEIKFKDKDYMTLGYNREPDDNMKHHRFFVSMALEKCEFFGKPPFQNFKIKKGQTRGLCKGLKIISKKISDCQKLSSLRNAGYFKGYVRISLSNSVESREIDKDLGKIGKLLLVKSLCFIRIYIIDAYDLISKEKSELDSYLVLKLGQQKYNDRENSKPASSHPKFYKHFDIPATFPGESSLKISLWDYNRIKSDKKIGSTKISLEDRFFNKSWNKMPDKPIETRKLKINSSKQPQGYLRLWIEIYPASEKIPPWDITPRPPIKFEVRVIIWDCKDVSNYDVEEVSDLFVKVSINSTQFKETDTHYRAQNGVASWNWRMKFPIDFTEGSKVILAVQLWDRDIFSKNDSIGDQSLEITKTIEEALDLSQTVKYFNNSKVQNKQERLKNEKFWIQLMNKDKNGQDVKVGQVRMSVEVLPWDQALAIVNGEGRSQPNVEPRLAKPFGRFEFTINPFKLFNQMVGPRIRRKVYCYCCGLICCLIIFISIPVMMADMVSKFMII